MVGITSTAGPDLRVAGTWVAVNLYMVMHDRAPTLIMPCQEAAYCALPRSTAYVCWTLSSSASSF